MGKERATPPNLPQNNFSSGAKLRTNQLVNIVCLGGAVANVFAREKSGTPAKELVSRAFSLVNYLNNTQ